MVPSYLMAQGNCCCCLLKEAGQKAERDGNLRTAISEWDDAKKCSDVGRCPELNNLIASAKAKIEEEARDIGKVKQCEDEIERLKGQISQFNNRLNKSESENDNLKSEKVKLSRQITEYEDKIWEIVDSTNNVDIYKAYCREFPNGKYSRIAKQKSGGNSEISTTPELARVPGGNFQMGYSDAPVQVNTFYLSKFEVTNAQYCIFLNEMGNQQVGNSSWINIGGTENGCPCKIIPKGTKFQVQSGFENHPVAFVTWYGASSYCEWLSNKTGKFYHLPSRAQWEYAAGNGVKHTTYSWGFENPIGKEGGNILDVSYGKYINKDDENEIRLPYGVYVHNPAQTGH